MDTTTVITPCDPHFSRTVYDTVEIAELRHTLPSGQIQVEWVVTTADDETSYFDTLDDALEAFDAYAV